MGVFFKAVMGVPRKAGGQHTGKSYRKLDRMWASVISITTFTIFLIVRSTLWNTIEDMNWTVN